MRHGQTVMNVNGHYAGQIETPLTAEGRKQARKAARNTQDLNIDLILASPFSRALETAEIFATQIGYDKARIHTSPLLVERSFGLLEGKPHDPTIGYDREDLGIEGDEVLVQRAHLALLWINNFDSDHILVVSHGSFGRALRSILKTEYPMSHPEKINNAELLCWIEEN